MDIVNRIKEEISIKQVIEDLTGTKLDSKNKILCFFHDEKNPSLNINNEKGLFYCFGCKTGGDLIKFCELYLKTDRKGAIKYLANRYNIPLKSNPINNKKGKISKLYDYHNAEGELVYQVVRLEPKSFRQRRPDGRGGWIWNMKGINPLPYRLPQLLKAIERGDTVFITEGEKDADALVALGLTATCNHGGAGKWRKSHSKYFPAGTSVVILPDNDEPGQKHAEEVAQKLLDQNCQVKVINLPGLPKKGDVSDWINAGGTKEKLLQLVAEAPLWERKKENPGIFHLTDLGNAQRLVYRYGRDIRYCHPWNKWLTWTGTHWAIDDTAAVVRFAKDTVRQIYIEASEEEDERARKAIAEHAKRSEAKTRITNMISLAASEPGIPILPDQLDRNPWLLNVANGTIDLKTAQLKPHKREDLITKIAPVNYDPSAKCPTWLSFLDRIMNGKQELIKFLQRAIGYALTGDTSEQVIFIFHGSGANGKSTFLETISAMLGDGYAQQTPTSTLMVRRNETIPNDIARLKGARFVTAVEAEAGQRLAESLVKQMSGQDKLVARFMRGEFFEFRPV